MAFINCYDLGIEKNRLGGLGYFMEKLNLVVLFLEGVVSFLSPCVLPIIPVYLSMLSNSSVENLKNGKFIGSSLFKNTLFFVLGISSTFFILGSSVKALGSFFNTNKNIIMILGGIVIIVMGLFYIGVIKSTFLSREKRFNTKVKEMNSIGAFILGFTFSFGWTPCIGPILASVLIMSSTSEGSISSNMLILVYTLGFILPFILVSLFYKKLFGTLDKIKKHMNKIKIVGGMVLIGSGMIMAFNGVSGEMEKVKLQTLNTSHIEAPKQSNNESKGEINGGKERIAPIDFDLYDQYGNKHKLSDYKGKTVFLNFWATWCPPCRREMPHIEELYKEYNYNKGDVIILGVASPDVGKEGNQEYIEKFLKKEKFTFPVVFDKGGSQSYEYGIYALPSTFIIDKDGYIKQYIPGAMDKKTMKELIENAR